MKKRILFPALLSLLGLFGSCTDDFRNDEGDGFVSISAKLNDEMINMSRAVSDAEQEELKANATIWISEPGKGVVRKYKGFENVPAAIGLKSGAYLVEIWAGDSVAGSWDKKWFKAAEPFEVSYGQTTQVNAVCKIANVAVAVRYPDGIEEVINDLTFTVNHPQAELVFNGVEDAADKTAYFMMTSTAKDLRYTLKGKQIDGKEINISNTLRGVKSGVKYILRLKYDPEGEQAGGVAFDFVTEEEPMGDTENVELIAPPLIQGYGFKITETQVVPQGKIGRKVVHISSSTNVTEAVITSELFKPFLNENSVDLTRVNDDVRNLLASNGITFKYHDPYEAVEDDDTEGGDTKYDDATLMHINFNADLLDQLPNGEHVFLISALDDQGHRSVRSFRLKVTDSSTQVLPSVADDATFDAVTLRAVLLKDNVEKIGFNWRLQGDTEWNFIEGTTGSRAYDAGSQFYATITGLKDGIAIEYAPVADEFVDVVSIIRTKEHSYLPNSSFEQWFKNSKGAWLPCDKEADMFWDTGNHGSITTGVNVTEYDETIYHSGSRSIKLESKYPSILGMGKFAAGNVFIGKYLKTDGTNGILGWGRPWSERPKGLKGYVKYRPVPIDQGKPEYGYNKGDMDKGLIKIALVNNSVTYGSEVYGFVVETKNPTTGLFTDDADYVVALGKLVLTEATEGEGLVEFDIEIKDVHPGAFNHIIIVASSSMGGDYFAGGVGSTMWLDDVQVYY